MSINNADNDNDIRNEILNHAIPEEIVCSARVRGNNIIDSYIYISNKF
jgi:hypothetical protein